MAEPVWAHLHQPRAAVMMMMLVFLPSLLSSTFAAAAAVAEPYPFYELYASQPLTPANGLTPRYFIDASSPLHKRGSSCEKGQHPCLDVGDRYAGRCCDNNHYCYINKSNDLSCCPIGTNCKDESKCSSDAYYTVETVTVAVTATATGRRGPRTSSSISTSTSEGCARRRCPQTSNYLCPSSLGGNCCPFGQDCVKGGCASTVSAAPSQSTRASVPPDGCTTSQHACDDGGGGCCNDWQACTSSAGKGYCVLASPTASGVKLVGSHAGLSAGAKGGIAVGVIVGVALVVGVAAWLCVSSRRRKKQRHRSASQQTGTTSRPGDDASMGEMVSPLGRSHLGAGAGTSTASAAGRPSDAGLTQDYFGPDAVAGPFTERTASSAASPGPPRAVPPTPHGPNDIAAPVELDSPGSHPSEQNIAGRFELYGSAASPDHLAPPTAMTPNTAPTPPTPRSEAGRSTDVSYRGH